MKILAVDTTSLTATAAIIDGYSLLGEININNKLTHSQTMMPMIEELLNKTDLALSDINGFAVSAGPGSFTGIRIGISSMSSVAYSLRKPIVGVDTLNVIAMNVRYASSLIVPMINARNEQVFSAAYVSGEDYITNVKSDYFADDVKDVTHKMISIAENNKMDSITFVGDGSIAYKNIIKEICCENNINFACDIDSTPQAKMVGLLGGKMIEKIYDDQFDCNNINNYIVQPVYLRPSQAERLLGNK